MERAADKTPSELVAAREAAGLSTEELAEAIGTSAKHATRLERGHATPSFKTLRRWSKALGIEVGELADMIARIQR